MREKNDIEFNAQKDWASVKIYYEIISHEENKEKLPTDLWEEFDVFSKKILWKARIPILYK